jgi:ribosome modulation factor
MMVPLRELGRHDGFEVTFADASFAPGHPPVVTLDMLRGHDVVTAQRWNKHDGLHVWRRASLWAKLVYELDDDLWHITAENWNAYHHYEQPDIRDATAHAAETADLITVTTEPLAEVMREVSGHDRVAVLPNCIPEWVTRLPRAERARPRVGWQGGASHGVDIGQVAAPVRRFLKRFPSWDLQLNGSDYRETFKAPRDRVHFVGWVPVQEHPEKYFTTVDFDIGLAPLWPTQFARCKCIDSSMRISTNQGVLEAGTIESGMSVWLDGWREVQAVEHQPEQAGLRITTRRGMQVTVTLEHRLMSISGWRQARELRIGDGLRLVQERCPELPYQRMPWPADGRVTRAGAPDPMAFLTATEGPSVVITETWGRIFGLFTGDGSVGNKTAIKVSCDGQDQDLIKLLMADLESAGFRATTNQATTFSGEILRKREVRTASGHLVRFLLGAGLLQLNPETGWRERSLRVPDVVFRSPEQVRAAFLSGLFEADGHNTGSGVSMTTKSEDLARDVQRLLWSIGIPSGLHRKRGSQRSPYADRIYWAVELRLEEAKLFALHVGFLSERKNGILAGLLERDRTRTRPANGMKPIRWTDEIETIELCRTHPVDIQVDGEAYSAAGIHSHNSAIKAIEYGARGIPTIATDIEPYRDVITHGVDGFLVRSDHEWLKYMSELAGDGELRAKMGEAAREMARRHLIEDHWQDWAAAYRGMFR